MRTWAEYICPSSYCETNSSVELEQRLWFAEVDAHHTDPLIRGGRITAVAAIVSCVRQRLHEGGTMIRRGLCLTQGTPQLRRSLTKALDSEGGAEVGHTAVSLLDSVASKAKDPTIRVIPLGEK